MSMFQDVFQNHLPTTPLLRVPLSLSVFWAVNTTLTRPQLPATVDEWVEPVGLEVSVVPIFIKACFWIAGLAEILVILANAYPTAITECLGSFLMHWVSLLDVPSITWPFIFAWACTISGAVIRRRCYNAMGVMFTFELSIRKNHKLVTTGPYSIVRHPSYSGGALALFGALACHTTPGSLFLSVLLTNLSPALTRTILLACYIFASSIAFLVVVPRLDKEDTMLKGEFGPQWEDWAQRVPYSLIPGVY